MADLSEVYGGPLHTESAIFTYLEQGLQRVPNAEAIVVRHQPADHLSELLPTKSTTKGPPGSIDCLRWTYSQLHGAATQLAISLLEAGLESGSLVVTFIPNCAEWLLIAWASALGKFGLSHLDAGSLSDARRAELDNYLFTLKPAAIVVADSTGAAAIDAVLTSRSLSPLRINLDNTSPSPSRWTSPLKLCAAPKPQDTQDLLRNARTDSPTRIAYTLFTSGTSSGRPKGCPRAVHTILNTISEQPWARPGDAQKHARFAVHTANFRAIAPMLIHCAWKAGATVVLPGPGFTPASFLTTVQEECITETVLIPAQLHLTVADPSFQTTDTSSLRLLLSGGDMVTRSLALKAQQYFPSAAFMNGHGMTEGGGLFSWPYWDKPIPYYGEIAPLGHPALGARLKIVGNDGVTVKKRGETGELHIQSSGMISSYLGNTNSETFYSDSEGGQWFRTGDLGMINSSGDVYILGRLKDVIVRAGVNITPAALESCLSSYTGAQVAVLPVQHEMLGQVPFAVLSAFPARFTVKDLQTRVLELFGEAFALEGAVELNDLELERMPLNATGKVQKLELVEPLGNWLEGKGKGSGVEE